MICRSFLLLVVLAGPLSAQQQINVQSGEHDGFTRLALTIDPNVVWEIDQELGQATLHFPDQQLAFVTDSIFDRIAKTRIAAVSESQSENGSDLELTLACDCPISSFDFKGSYIIIDIAEGPPLPEGATQQAANDGPPTTDPRWQPQALELVANERQLNDPFSGIVTTAPMQPRLIPDQPLAENNMAQTPILLEPLAPPDVTIEIPMDDLMDGLMPTQEILDFAANTVASEDPEMRERIEQAQAQLLEQLSRAADQGLLDYITPEVEVPTQPIDIPEPIEEPTQIVQSDPELLRQLSARTAYDQPSENLLTDIVNQFAMPQCLDNANFTMENWSNGDSFSDQVGVLRSGLIGEFDQPNKDKLASLVQLYLRYGFAAEAGFILQENLDLLNDQAILLDLAKVLNGTPPIAAGPIAKGAGCGGAHEMWHLLDALHGDPVLDTPSILEAFGAYPIEIRTLIGPQLATSFLNRGQTEDAHTVLEIVRRADGHVTSAIRLAEARILEENQDHDAAVEIYSEIAAEIDTMAPNAMIELARSLLSQDYTIPADLLTDLSSAAFSHKGTPLGDELRLWEIRVEARVNGLENTLAILDDELHSGVLNHDDLREIAIEILEHAQVEQEGALAYARGVLEFKDLLITTPAADKARLHVAAQLVEIGLPQPALEFLNPSLERENEQAREIAARAYLQLFDSEKTREMVEGLDDTITAQILMEAGLQSHDLEAVARVLPSVSMEQAPFNQAAIRAGEWDQVRGDQTSAVVAAYLADPSTDDAAKFETSEEPEMVDAFLTDMAAPEHPSLQQVRALLEVNKASREYLRNLLDSDQPPGF